MEYLVLVGEAMDDLAAQRSCFYCGEQMTCPMSDGLPAPTKNGNDKALVLSTQASSLSIIALALCVKVAVAVRTCRVEGMRVAGMSLAMVKLEPNFALLNPKWEHTKAPNPFLARQR